jgi:hypothetical protein
MEPVIVERSDEAKLAYAQGFKAGWEWALNGVRRGLSPQDVEDACFTLSETLNKMLDE